MVNKAQPEDASIHIAAQRVVPKQPRNKGGNPESHEQNQLNVPPMLPPHNWVLGEVTNISHTGLPSRL
jgi:hypothetical protein